MVGTGAASLQLKSLLPDGVVHFGDAVVPTSSFVLAGDRDRDGARARRSCSASRASVWRRARPPSTRPVPSSRASRRIGSASSTGSSRRCSAGLAVILFAATSRPTRPDRDEPARGPCARGGALRRTEQLRGHDRAALAISMLQSALGTFQTRADWLPDWLPERRAAGCAAGRADRRRDHVARAPVCRRARRLVERRLPAAPEPRRPLAADARDLGGDDRRPAHARRAVAARDRGVDDRDDSSGCRASSLTGYVGQISLAQYAFAGLAAFTTAKLAIEGVAFPWAPLLAVALTVGVGILVGLPALRVRGMTLAVATLAAAVAIEELVFNSPSLNGLTDVPRPRLFGLDLGFLAHGLRQLPRPRSGSSQSWSLRSARSRSPTSVVARPACGGWPYAATNGLRRHWGST